MNMKVTVMVALAAVLVVALDGPMITAPCPALIQQANEQMADMDDPTGAQAQTAKALVAEADRLHKAGNHLRSIMAVQAALAGFH
jgi:hypothetical protein